MQKLKPALQTHSIRFIFLILMVITGYLILSAYHTSFYSIHIKLFFDQNKGMFFIWRLIVLIMFFFSWPIFVRHHGRRHKWPVSNIDKAIQLRYCYLVLLAGIELIFNAESLL